MSKKPAEIKAELERLLPAIEKIVNVLHNMRLDINIEDEEERFMAIQLYNQGELLKQIVWNVEYLNGQSGPVGKLKQNSAGRYALPNGDYWSSGDPIEIKIWDDDEERWEWIKTRIEFSHEKGDYYAVGVPNLNLEGVTARKRIEPIKWSRDW